jgi:hypothetical protein
MSFRQVVAQDAAAQRSYTGIPAMPIQSDIARRASLACEASWPMGHIIHKTVPTARPSRNFVSLKRFSLPDTEHVRTRCSPLRMLDTS